MVLLTAEVGLGHIASLCITTDTISPSVREVDDHVPENAPTIGLMPFIHWYVGDIPPYTGVAVNVTNVPPQTVSSGETVILTDAGVVGVTVTVMDVAGDQQPLTVSTTLYVPPSADVMPEMVGFCAVELYDEGPVQL